jgi:hypothetical protein
VSGRPDAPVFLQVAEARRGLQRLHPFLGVADIRRDVESLLDADHGVVHRDGPDREALILEARRPDLMALAAEKLAVRAQHPADVALGRLVLASVLSLEHPALADGSEERRVLRRAVAALYTPGADQFAA